MLGTLHTGNPHRQGHDMHLIGQLKKRCRKRTSGPIQDDAWSSWVQKLSKQHRRAATLVLKPQCPTSSGLPEEDQARYAALTEQGTCRQHREGFLKEDRE